MEKEKINLSLELIKIAKSDIEASKVLYENKLYAQAVYLFLQSVEKSGKAFGLLSRKIDKKELIHSIGHFPITIFQKIIATQSKEYSYFIKMQKEYPSLNVFEQKAGTKVANVNNVLQGFINNIKNIKNDWKETINVSEDTIKKHLAQIDSSYKTIENDFETNVVKKTKDSLKGFEGLIHSAFYPMVQGDAKQEAELKKALEPLTNGGDGMNRFIQVYCDFMKVAYPLIITSVSFSTLLVSHAKISRYPQEDLGLTPTKIYNEELPFIKLMPEMLEKQIRAVEGMEKYYNFVKEIEKNKNLLT